MVRRVTGFFLIHFCQIFSGGCFGPSSTANIATCFNMTDDNRGKTECELG